MGLFSLSYRGFYYTPHTKFRLSRRTSQAISFTNGSGPGGYTELSADRLAITRARIGAVNTLPYLVGSGTVVAQSYKDEVVAFATYEPWQLIVLPILIWILGVIGELFVPVLPLNIPRREFGLYSWLMLLKSPVRGLSCVPRKRANQLLPFRS